MNIYITTEPESKLKTLFSNIKSFYILDVQQFINEVKLDLTKQCNIYLINTEIMSKVMTAAKLKKYQGIIYINKTLTPSIIRNLQSKFKNIKEISKVVLIDNGTLPKHTDLHNICEEVYFYERFCRNKIIDCNNIFNTSMTKRR